MTPARAAADLNTQVADDMARAACQSTGFDGTCGDYPQPCTIPIGLCPGARMVAAMLKVWAIRARAREGGREG